jgi:uncharacterized membrane protein YraQ (UPF0718 family)
VYYLYIATGVALLASLIASRRKTLQALKIAARRFIKILPAFLIMLILVSTVLFLVPDKVISDYLGNNNNTFLAVLIASFFGSITLMPGFIVFPLCGILLEKGVEYMVLAAFTTTLMMVGILTYPIEKEYFGAKVTIIRNTISLLIALAVAVMIGIFFGEIF